MTTCQLLCGDALAVLQTLPAGSVQCVVTSPPYYGLRDYGVAGQIGLEETPEAYIDRLVAVFREVRRVLRPDGVIWVNIGDSYASDMKGSGGTAKRLASMGPKSQPVYAPRKFNHGVKPKDLVGIPWLLAFALRADGWYLRQDIIWHKPNPMPESVTDRCTKAHEYMFLLSKQQRYYFDAAAIAEDALTDDRTREKFNGESAVDTKMRGWGSHCGTVGGLRNKRSVWSIPTDPYPGAHFATFPEALVQPCILAGSKPGDTVLDPFAGSGTAGVVALSHGRSFIGIDLNPAYLELARQRLGLFAGEVSA